MKRRTAIALALTSAVLLQFASAAHATITHQFSFAGPGEEAGQLSQTGGIAINHGTGDVYVADYGNSRVEQFTESGTFVRAWGYDVVASGEDDEPYINEVDEVQVRATGGNFRLSMPDPEERFKSQFTSLLPFDASAAAVEAALNAVPAISAEGGSVSVTGGPGDPTASTPYVVTFDGGPLRGKDVALGIDGSTLALPAGTELTCSGSGPNGTTSSEFQWLADGAPVAGANGSTFIPGAAEEGQVIQCERIATGPEGVKVLGASQTYAIASGAGTVAPPLAPSFLATPTTSTTTALNVEGAPGGTITCNAGTWDRNPESYTYRWFRNGLEIDSPTTTTNTSDVHTINAADIASKAIFQCQVTGTNAGGASTVISYPRATNPSPQMELAAASATVTVPGGVSSRVVTTTTGQSQFEVCNAPPSNDVCKTGDPGSHFGQFNLPISIAVDESPGGEGAVYVQDAYNFRVQKFDAEGTPILAFGKSVDKDTNGDVCLASSGHTCGAGLRAVDESPVTMGYNGPEQNSTVPASGNELAVDGDGFVYVGEVRLGELSSPSFPEYGCPEGACHGRIQKFDSDGNYVSMLRLPPTNKAGFVAPPLSVAVDSHGTIYATRSTSLQPNLLRIQPDEFGPTGGSITTAGDQFLTEYQLRDVAIDPRNDRVLVSDLNQRRKAGPTDTVSACGGPQQPGRAVIELDTQMRLIDCSVPQGLGELGDATGLAVSEAGELFAPTGSGGKVKVFALPAQTPPDVGTQSATKITTKSVRLSALIDTGFEETNYSLEYGPEDCEISTCTKVDGEGVIVAFGYQLVSFDISGLSPDTTYHYRFLAENPRGADVGGDSTFRSYRLIDLVNDPCPNVLARKQTQAAGTLDCRAYELASAGWTGGYDVVSNVVPGQEPFEGYPDAPGRVLYGIKDGGIPNTGNPTNRGIDPYISERGENGWTTRYVGIPANNPFATAPFSSTLVGASSTLDTFAFGGPDVCDPCFADGSSGMPVRLPDGQLIQGVSGSQPDPTADRAGHVAKPLSPDGSNVVFGTTAALEPTATAGEQTLYERSLDSPNAEVISTLPDGSTMTGEVGELDISENGSRTVVAEKLGTDAAGNPLWHPYLHISGNPDSIDLAEGTTTGVHFSGMTADGSTLFFSTADQLPVDQPFQDEDESVDIYRAQVDQSGNATLELVTVDSSGDVSNSDACEPPGRPRVWNAVAGEGRCNAVPLAGGAGVAADDGTFFFISPEQLEAGKGIANQANLYVVGPGGPPQPRFVATIDNALEKPGDVPPQFPLATAKFGKKQFKFAAQIAVDQSSQDVYIVEAATGSVQRFHANGTPSPFSAGPDANTNTLTGFSFEITAPSTNQIAVDNSPASAATPLHNALYVPSGSTVEIYGQSGAPLGSLTGSGTVAGAFSNPCGVAVNEQTGTVYVAQSGGQIWQYAPASPAADPEITDADYTVKGIATGLFSPCTIAADRQGNVFFANARNFFLPGNQLIRIPETAFTTANPPPTVAGSVAAPVATAAATDPKNDELYVDTGFEIQKYDSGGALEVSFGSANLNCPSAVPGFPWKSRGVAVNSTTDHIYASCMEEQQPEGLSSIREWEYVNPPYAPINNPAVVHGVLAPERHVWGDFQVTPDASYAAFSSLFPLEPKYDNAGHYEVQRYDVAGEDLHCVSCNPTGGQATSDSALPRNGLGVLSDGRVFFNTGEPLTLADTNGNLDAYEWSPQRDAVGGCDIASGCQQLISTGTSAHASGMLGASADGTDAFFFTRDTLVPEDENGEAMKIYDARAEGGFFAVPPPPPCAASDECHGPGTSAQSPPQIGTFKGTGGQFKPHRRHCRRGFRRKHGHCVRRKSHKRKVARRRHHHRRSHRGGAR